MELKFPVNAIFLDLGWTLMYPKSGDWMLSEPAKEILEAHGFFELPEEKVKHAFAAAHKFLIADHHVETVEKEYQQFRRFYEIVSDLLPELMLRSIELDKMTQAKVYSDELYGLFDDTVETLEYLSKKYKLGVISDTWPAVERWLKKNNIYHYFSSFTFSCFLGCFKPDRRMYEHALNSLGVSPEESVFVDDFSMNLEGAARVGIQPVWIKAKPNLFEENALAGANGEDISDEFVSIDRISDLTKLL